MSDSDRSPIHVERLAERTFSFSVVQIIAWTSFVAAAAAGVWRVEAISADVIDRLDKTEKATKHIEREIAVLDMKAGIPVPMDHDDTSQIDPQIFAPALPTIAPAKAIVCPPILP